MYKVKKDRLMWWRMEGQASNTDEMKNDLSMSLFIFSLHALINAQCVNSIYCQYHCNLN